MTSVGCAAHTMASVAPGGRGSAGWTEQQQGQDRAARIDALQMLLDELAKPWVIARFDGRRGAGGRDRTDDLPLTRRLLDDNQGIYQLRYCTTGPRGSRLSDPRITSSRHIPWHAAVALARHGE